MGAIWQHIAIAVICLFSEQNYNIGYSSTTWFVSEMVDDGFNMFSLELGLVNQDHVSFYMASP